MLERRRSLRNDSAFMLAVVIVLGFFGIAFLVLLREVPKDSQPIAQGILTATQMMLGGIIGYFYGASKTAMEQKQLAPVSIAAPTEPLKTDTVNVQADTANVTTEVKS